MSRQDIWVEKIRISLKNRISTWNFRFSQNHSRCFQKAWNRSGGVPGVSKHILHDIRPFSKHFSKKNQKSKPALDKRFVWVKLDLVVKTRFGVEKLEFFRIQYESHDQTLAARRSQGHYLKSLGTDFSYRFYLLKKIIFWAPMPSKSKLHWNCL